MSASHWLGWSAKEAIKLGYRNKF